MKGGLKMTCFNFEELISLYIDNMLDEHTKKIVEEHLDECKECKYNYDAIISNINICKELPSIPLPDNYQDSLHEKLVALQEEPKKVSLDKPVPSTSKKSKRKSNWKIYATIAASFIILIVTVGSLNVFNMGSSSSKTEMAKDQSMEIPRSEAPSYGIATDDARSEESAPELKMFSANESIESEGQTFDVTTSEINNRDIRQKQSGRKVINNAFVNLDIEEYDEKFDQIVNIISTKGGHIQHSNTEYKHYVRENPEESLKRGNLSVRVPESAFLDTVNEIKAIGIVTNYGSSGEDITTQYRDTANEIENLKVQEERLREIMLKAENVEDILAVERELTRVRGNINAMTGDIQRWDDLVELSTINISLNEVVNKDKRIQTVSDNIWDKAGKGFIRTINGLLEFAEIIFIGFVSFLPIIIITGLIIGIVILVIKRLIRRD